MEFFFRFVHPVMASVLTLCLVIVSLIKWYWPRRITYNYSLTSALKNVAGARNWIRTPLITALRCCAFMFLILAVGRPQIPDYRTHVRIDGISIVLVLDVSGSMQFVDEHERSGQRSRLDVAKREAIRFINKRNQDAIGLVIFGKSAVSRCPLTYDKAIVRDIINDISIGVVDPDGTVLASGMLTAVNRLRRSKAKSNIMILLTDGEPSPEDIDSSIAIQAAQQCGIKVYTIGIGTEEDEFQFHPMYGMIPKAKINKGLLTNIAEQTGGQFFLARNAQDMATIYDTIDRLEKTEHDVDQYARYIDFFIPLLICALICLVAEIILTSVWFVI